jgi:hypothetical protein
MKGDWRFRQFEVGLQTDLHPMEKQSKTKVAMTFGAYNGLSAVIVMILFYLIDFDAQSKIPSVITYALMTLFIVLGMRTFRDRDNDGFISYGSAVGTGTLISLIGGVIQSVYSVIFIKFIDPSFTEKAIEVARQKLIEDGTPDNQIEMGLEIARTMMSPMWLFFFGIIGSLFVGAIISLIVAAFVKKEANPFQSNIS